MIRRDPETIDIDVSLPDGDAVVTVRITAWPTRATWGYSGGDPASPGEWDVLSVAGYCGGCHPECPGDHAFPVGDLSNADRDIIDAAVAEHLAGDR